MVIGGLVLQEVPTWEVRWIRPGALPTWMIEWFGRLVREVESREDTYLVGRRIQGVSVKIRGGTLLDVKVATEGRNHGVLDVPGRARGRIQSWRKSSFPIAIVPPAMEVASPDWVRVGKMRRIGRFGFANGRPTAHDAENFEDEATCAVELTEVTQGEELWWTLGFEAAGNPTAARAAIDATAAVVFDEPMPGGLQLSVVDSMSYSEWLHRSNPDRSRTLLWTARR